MRFPRKPSRTLTLALFVMVLVGQSSVAEAQDCVALKSAVESELSDFLHKKLVHQLSRRTLELIAQWRQDYADNVLLSDTLVETESVISAQQQAAETAEVGYLETSAQYHNSCPNG